MLRLQTYHSLLTSPHKFTDPFTASSGPPETSRCRGHTEMPWAHGDAVGTRRCRGGTETPRGTRRRREAHDVAEGHTETSRARRGHTETSRGSRGRGAHGEGIRGRRGRTRRPEGRCGRPSKGLDDGGIRHDFYMTGDCHGRQGVRSNSAVTRPCICYACYGKKGKKTFLGFPLRETSLFAITSTTSVTPPAKRDIPSTLEGMLRPNAATERCERVPFFFCSFIRGPLPCRGSNKKHKKKDTSHVRLVLDNVILRVI